MRERAVGRDFYGYFAPLDGPFTGCLLGFTVFMGVFWRICRFFRRHLDGFLAENGRKWRDLTTRRQIYDICQQTNGQPGGTVLLPPGGAGAGFRADAGSRAGAGATRNLPGFTRIHVPVMACLLGSAVFFGIWDDFWTDFVGKWTAFGTPARRPWRVIPDYGQREWNNRNTALCLAKSGNGRVGSRRRASPPVACGCHGTCRERARIFARTGCTEFVRKRTVFVRFVYGFAGKSAKKHA